MNSKKNIVNKLNEIFDRTKYDEFLHKYIWDYSDVIAKRYGKFGDICGVILVIISIPLFLPQAMIALTETLYKKKDPWKLFAWISAILFILIISPILLVRSIVLFIVNLIKTIKRITKKLVIIAPTSSTSGNMHTTSTDFSQSPYILGDALCNAAEDEVDSYIEQLKAIPDEYRTDLSDAFGPAGAIIRSLGKGNVKLACLCLILPENHFKVKLDSHIKIKIRLPVTETPQDRMIISSCLQVLDSQSPGIDEHFHLRDKHLRRMIGQDHTFLIIADRMYIIYFKRKICFDENMKHDLRRIEKAFMKYGEENEHPTIGDDPTSLYALQWYQNNVSMHDILRKYF